MKKVTKLLTLLIVVSLTVLTAVSVYADTLDRSDPAYFVYDDAHLLSESQWSKLNEKAKEISGKYGCGLYIVTVDDFTDYTSDYDVLTAAENIYSGMDFGVGDDRNGQMLLLSMDDRDYALIAFGDYANYAFTDYGKDLIIDEFLDDFRDDDWYGGFDDYLDESERLLKEAAKGQPVDILVPDDPYDPSYPVIEPKKLTLADYLQRYLMMLLPSSLASLITCSVLRSKSKNVRTATNANQYIDRGLTLYASNDMFMHRSQTRRVIPRDTGSHGGGGGGSHYAGTTVNSHGFSGKSGKF